MAVTLAPLLPHTLFQATPQCESNFPMGEGENQDQAGAGSLTRKP
jgi:hypothetical protein